MSSAAVDWTSNDWSILLASCAGIIASCFAGARLSNCVRISVCGPDGWLHVERRLQAPAPTPQVQNGTIAIPRLTSSPSIESIATTMALV